MDLKDFYDGQEFYAFDYLGAQCQKRGVVFRTYAPNAEAVSVIGEFNGWTDTQMEKVENGQFWEVKVRNAKPGQMYKFRIYGPDGSCRDHADPYAFFSEKRPGTASVIYNRNGYEFHDADWMWTRRDRKKEPLNIYEMHLGSWRRRDDPEIHARALDDAKAQGIGIDVSDGWYTYDELVGQIVPYLQENHYNYLEIMPLNEYPADESWGYQSLGFFSATSRYGNPDGLKRLIDTCHLHGIGVILDVVTVHFAVNDYGLWRYDGTPLYEHDLADRSTSEWGSCNFNHSRGDVRSFLNSASEYWLKDFHFDGLRFDAVGNLIYWQGDQNQGTDENAIAFLKNMNNGLKKIDGNVMLIAEDSSAYPNVTAPVSRGGLGFDYKWDMGWMNDTLNYFRTPPQERMGAYHKLTFSMQYFYNESYLLPLSHDEVVHGKATIMQKMAGDYEDKFPQGRALYIYMMTHPGKKLNFMGNEIGQLREWDEKREQDWFLTKYPIHDAYHRFTVDMNALYMQHSAFWQKDYDRVGFQWIEADDTRQCVYVYRRTSDTEGILCFFNFSRQEQTYLYRPTGDENLHLLIDSDDCIYNGTTPEEKLIQRIEVRKRKGAVPITLPPYSARLYQEVMPSMDTKGSTDKTASGEKGTCGIGSSVKSRSGKKGTSGTGRFSKSEKTSEAASSTAGRTIKSTGKRTTKA
ncbi:MAG: 1,4-alpha-glucan branching protein GlgB [Bilifractor sp.]